MTSWMRGLVLAGLLGAAGQALAFLTLEIPVESLPSSCLQNCEGLLLLEDDPTPYPSTDLFGPHGQPSVMSLVFDYDSVLVDDVVDHFQIQAGNCLQEWAPAPGSVVYQPGAVFPLWAQIQPFYDSCCWEFDLDCDGDGAFDCFDATLRLVFPAERVPLVLRPRLQAVVVQESMLPVPGEPEGPADDSLRVRFDLHHCLGCSTRIWSIVLSIDDEVRDFFPDSLIIEDGDVLEFPVDFEPFTDAPDRPAPVTDLSARATATALVLEWSPVDTTLNGLPLPEPVYRVSAADGPAGPFLPIGETVEPGFSDPWTVYGPALRLYRVTVRADSLGGASPQPRIERSWP